VSRHKANQAQVDKKPKEEIRQALINKIDQYWSSLKQAFNAINLSKSGKIKQWELRYYLKHWGLEPNDTIFN